MDEYNCEAEPLINYIPRLDNLIAENERLKGLNQELVEAIEGLGPLEVASGDAIHRTHPESRRVVNTSATWLVGPNVKSEHKLRIRLRGLTDLLARARTL